MAPSSIGTSPRDQTQPMMQEEDDTNVSVHTLTGILPPPPPARVRLFKADDPRIQLPPDDVAQSDCIQLSRLFLASLKDPHSTFTVQSLSTVRQWAKARHLYGTPFGYPGGSAWASMLWAYTQWLDYAFHDDDIMSVSEVLRC